MFNKLYTCNFLTSAQKYAKHEIKKNFLYIDDAVPDNATTTILMFQKSPQHG